MTDPEVISYDQAIQRFADSDHLHLLLGNGFSIALKPDIFTYGSLFEQAKNDLPPSALRLFQALNTQDFEAVIRHLQDAATVVKAYRPDFVKLQARLLNDASSVKEILVKAIASNHPSLPSDVKPRNYHSCREFLKSFRGIYTLNYDVLLYWTLMQDEAGSIDLEHDDGFRHPLDDSSKPYVTWEQAKTASVHYLHGALHLFDGGYEIIKYTWSKTDVPIIDQVRSALQEDKFPIFVAEGVSSNKKDRILHNAYLHKALRSFEAICNNSKNTLLIYGHSLDENDDHILQCIARGTIPNVLISVFDGAVKADKNRIKRRAQYLQSIRTDVNPKKPLNIMFYDAASARVWDRYPPSKWQAQ